jgi:hypothetical protein
VAQARHQDRDALDDPFVAAGALRCDALPHERLILGTKDDALNLRTAEVDADAAAWSRLHNGLSIPDGVVAPTARALLCVPPL